MTRPDERDHAPPSGDPFGSPSRGGKADRGGRTALMLGLPGAVLSVLFAPLGLLLDVTAIVVGVRALRRAKQQRSTAPGAIPGIVFGSIGAFLVVIVLSVFAFFFQEVRTYQECMSGANTIRSQETCMRQFENEIERRFR